MRKGLTLLAILIAFSVAGNFFWRRVDMWRFPWGYEGSGKPTLTGTWVGSVSTATGQRRGVLLEMHLPDITNRKRKYRRGRFGNFEGTARTCDEHGATRAYTIYGNPDNSDATQLHFGSTPTETPM